MGTFCGLAGTLSARKPAGCILRLPGGSPIARVPLPISCDVLPANPAHAPYGSHDARVSVKRNKNAESAQKPPRAGWGNAKEGCDGKQGYSRRAGSTLGCL